MFTSQASILLEVAGFFLCHAGHMLMHRRYKATVPEVKKKNAVLMKAVRFFDVHHLFLG